MGALDNVFASTSKSCIFVLFEVADGNESKFMCGLLITLLTPLFPWLLTTYEDKDDNTDGLQFYVFRITGISDTDDCDKLGSEDSVSGADKVEIGIC